MASIELRNVCKTYDEGALPGAAGRGPVRAVADATLSFQDGEFIVLVGPSGCGKSTLLRMIAGLETITSGTISIGGRVVNEVAPKDRDVAMVFQNYALYPHMTVRANIAFGLLRRRRHAGPLAWALRHREWAAERAEIDAKVAAAARTLGIEAELDRQPRALSGGQRQRVALGRALVRDPQVFLFDEPLSNLDARLRIEMRAELRELHRRTRASMVYVTHDQEEAMTLADRMVVMRGGVVQQFATPAVCYARPANRFVAGFVGTPVMNFVEGRVEGATLRGAGLELPLPAARWPSPPAGAAVLGVRPDQLRVEPAGAGAAAGAHARLAARLDAIERLGDRMDLVLSAGAQRLVARVPNDERLAEGTEVAVTVDLSAAHLFAADEAGARLPDALDRAG
ncbi:MAG: ATP-binding cassette domain-containing protein [Phycisphaerales bacterium]